MPTNPTPADGPEPDMPDTDSREWPEAVDADPVLPDTDVQAILQKRDRSRAMRVAAAMMGVTEEAVRDALYIRHHDEELFQLTLSGDVHLEDAKEILAGTITLDYARKLAPIRHRLDKVLEKAEEDPRILERLEALISETENASAEHKANLPPNESGGTNDTTPTPQ